MTDQLNYDDARHNAKRKLYFINHIKYFIVVNIFLSLINWLSSPGYWWVLWPFSLWGVLLILNFSIIYLFSGEKTLEKLTRRELEKQKKRMAEKGIETGAATKLKSCCK